MTFVRNLLFFDGCQRHLPKQNPLNHHTQLGEVARAKEAELSAVDRELHVMQEKALQAAIDAQNSKEAAERYKAQMKNAEISIVAKCDKTNPMNARS